jgi:hypothetical protein
MRRRAFGGRNSGLGRAKNLKAPEIRASGFHTKIFGCANTFTPLQLRRAGVRLSGTGRESLPVQNAGRW